MACGLSSCSSWATEHGLSTGDAQAYLLCAAGSSQIRDQTLISCIGRQILYYWSLGKPSNRIFSFNLNFFFQWSQVLQITLLALDSLKVLPVGGYVPFGLFIGKEHGFQERGLCEERHSGSSYGSCCWCLTEMFLWTLTSSLIIKDWGRTQREEMTLSSV